MKNLAIVFLVFLISLTITGYKYPENQNENQKWEEKTTVSVYINTEDTEKEKTIESGCNLWTTFQNNITIKYVNNFEDSQVKIILVDKSELKDIPSQIGHCVINYNKENNIIINGDIKIMNNLHGELLKQVAAHEFGHCLGMSHSSNKQDIMYPISHTPVIITKSDIIIFNNIYKENNPTKLIAGL